MSNKLETIGHGENVVIAILPERSCPISLGRRYVPGWNDLCGKFENLIHTLLKLVDHENNMGLLCPKSKGLIYSSQQNIKQVVKEMRIFLLEKQHKGQNFIKVECAQKLVSFIPKNRQLCVM